jgi:hypothetical protein
MTPLYRATVENTNMGIGYYPKGATFTWQGWPKCCAGAVEPANTAAERIVDYWNAHRHDALLPQTPFNSDHGRIFLPHHLPHDPRSTRLPGLPRVEIDGMPRWCAEIQQQFGNKQVQIGDEFAWCGWPVEGIAPVNDAARRVVKYFEANTGNSRLLSSPWCDGAQKLFLPDLPQPKKGPGSTDGYARDVSIPPRDSWQDEALARRLGEARASMQQGVREAWAMDVNQARVDNTIAARRKAEAANSSKRSRRRVSA